MSQSKEPENNRKYLGDCVDGFADVTVMVIGDVIMDQYIWGNVSRISPEAPVPVVDVGRETKMLGGSANVIHNMAMLGARPYLCGVVGDDPTGEEIIERLRTAGLATDGLVIESQRRTSIKTRVVAHGQQIVRFDREDRIPVNSESIRNLLQFIGQKFDALDAIVVSDYGKGVISDPLMKGLRKLVKSSLGESAVIAVDPKTDNFQYYKEVDVITPNHHEAGAFCGFDIIDKDTLVRAGRKMVAELNCRSVLITQGKDGMTLFENGGEITHIPTVAKEVFDVTGAGDTVISTFSLGLASGLDLKSSAVLSNYAAGIVVGQVGTSAVSAVQLKQAVENR
ncbi:MAG: D-glycero-beta-D-manno-heptose-7-phosphate kinase [Deltaproteobacteria bacterium]|nr:D-glycero-beta-D-manno-heptose-7-phosphate kinase [Deltaproteobacteria bacterium]